VLSISKQQYWWWYSVLTIIIVVLILLLCLLLHPRLLLCLVLNGFLYRTACYNRTMTRNITIQSQHHIKHIMCNNVSLKLTGNNSLWWYAPVCLGCAIRLSSTYCIFKMRMYGFSYLFVLPSESIERSLCVCLLLLLSLLSLV
jgi:hypothetical protein